MELICVAWLENLTAGAIDPVTFVTENVVPTWIASEPPGMRRNDAKLASEVMKHGNNRARNRHFEAVAAMHSEDGAIVFAA